MAMAMARTELRVTVLGANDLRRGGGLRAMCVYSLLWIDPAVKLSTRVHCEGGPHPVWNDELVFGFGEDDLLFPHSVITIKVVSESQGEGSSMTTLLGTAYLPLAEIAMIKGMRENPEDQDIVQLRLITPSGHLEGSINLSISLVDRSQRFSTTARVSSNQSTQTVMGYPVGSLQPTPYEVHQEVPSSDMEAHEEANFQVYSTTEWGLPVPIGAGPGLYYPPSQEESLSFIQTPQPRCPCRDQTTRMQRRRNTAWTLLGGVIAGFVIGDILGVLFG